MRILNFFVRAAVKTIMICIKLLTFAITVSLALVKFVLGIALVILSLGAFASSTSKY